MEQMRQVGKMELVNTCNELNAAYAADGYARIKGIGCVCTTYGVGELSAINGVAGSYAERIPVVVLTGAPSVVAEKKGTKLHHVFNKYVSPRKMFKEVCVYTCHLDDAESAPREIDAAIVACLSQQRPVYISLPADMVHAKCVAPQKKLEAIVPEVDQGALEEALKEAAEMINKSSKPLIIGDAEIERYKLENQFAALLDASGLPYTTLMMGKALLNEDHPQFIGIYLGNQSRAYVKNRVDTADVVLQIGLVMSDLNTGGFTIAIPADRSIEVFYDRVKIKNHWYEKVEMKNFLEGLAKLLKKKDPSTLDIHKATEGCTFKKANGYKPDPSKELTVSRFFDRVSHTIPKNAIVLAETGLSEFGVSEILFPENAKFIGQVYYGSIGYTVGATLGVAVAAPDRPVVLFIGDGSFQVTAQDLSTMIWRKLKPTIYLLNNDGYTIERLIVDGPYNDVNRWKYAELPAIFGGEKGYKVATEGELESALTEIEKRGNSQLNFVELILDRMDCTESLRHAGSSMAKNNFIQTK
eukprot:TRINITY_DN2535_c0_g1_i1.p1 TRINITY_DN2535_c0_g1~~TRINITY_DN2535_c0_g1_i1.p1  ORF type:complete len:573 (-),score=194.08 TRINITY_DN2535_c0_g1_i1:51-1628(-)